MIKKSLFILPFCIVGLASCGKTDEVSLDEAMLFIEEHVPQKKTAELTNALGKDVSFDYYDMTSLGKKGFITCRSCGFRYQSVFHEPDYEFNLNYDFNNKIVYYQKKNLMTGDSDYSRYRETEPNVIETRNIFYNQVGFPVVETNKNEFDVVSCSITNQFQAELVDATLLRESIFAYKDRKSLYEKTYEYSFQIINSELHAKQSRKVYAKTDGVVNVGGLKGSDSDIQIEVNVEYIVNSSGLITYGKFYYTYNNVNYVATEYKIVEYNQNLTDYMEEAFNE